ncbi:hypothetical protein [Streptomyces sp. NPDC001135]
MVYIQTPVTAKPKSTCQTILNFFDAPTKGMTLPQLINQVACSLDDHGVKALILDDVTRLRMHRADDQDTLDLIRAFMSMNVTLILVGADIPGSGLLREAKRDVQSGQWRFPPTDHTRIHGLEVTQTERRFDLVELDHFRYTTSDDITAFHHHLRGIQENLRLLEAPADMLTAGTMPEYLFRRTDGVISLLERLIEDGCQEAMGSGKELLDENLLDEIIISLDDPSRDPAPVKSHRSRRPLLRTGRQIIGSGGPAPSTAGGRRPAAGRSRTTGGRA